MNRKSCRAFGRLVACVPRITSTSYLFSRKTALTFSVSSVHYSVRMQAATSSLLNFKVSASDIEDFTNQLVSDYDKVLDEIGALKESDLTFENTVKKMHLQDGEAATLSARITLPSMVSADKEARDTANKCKKRLYDFWSGIYSLREDVYTTLKAFDKKVAAKEVTLATEEDKRILERTLKLFERNGLSLTKEKRAQLVELRKKASELGNTFERRLNEDTTAVAFTAEELEGCEKEFVNNLKQVEREGVTKYLVSMKVPEYLPVIKKAIHSDTRKALATARDSRCLENGESLRQLLDTKHEAAQLMGYETHAHYQLEVKMAQTPKNVFDFLNDICNKLESRRKEETAVLLELKKEDMEKRGLPFSGKLDPWDYSFYERVLEETKYNVDEEIVQQYFPLEYVIGQILDMYMHLLGLDIKELTDENSREGVWHEEVRLFEVRDKATNELLGHFYLDIFPRDGKYSHQCVYPLQPSYVRKDGSMQRPAAAFIGNLTRASATRPSLLKSSEVRTIFHEFGHLMHCICTKSAYTLFSWAWTAVPWPGGVEQDFLEAPSQMLENWMWEPEVLQKLSGHYTDSSKKLPEELAKRVVTLRNVNSGIDYNRMCFMSLLDMKIHSGMHFDDKNTIADLWAKMKKEITGIDCIEGTDPTASWYHLVMGYDAGYYGYLWAEVFSSDMYRTVFTTKEGQASEVKGFLDPAKGMHYRKCICEPGATVDGMQMLKAFLGREPNSVAFFDILNE